jgi:amidase
VGTISAIDADRLGDDATAQAELVRRGDVSPVELIEAAIASAERCNPRLNAIVTERFDRCLDEARRFRARSKPFAGVPILLKDYGAASAGDPLHCGSQLLKRLGWTEPEDSHVVTLLRHAGFLLLGRTNTPEFAAGQITVNDAYGATRNPHDTSRTPGGSSGGSAAAVASGMVAIAHGTDNGGSVRVPAALCGVIGLKPSRGRVSLGPQGYASGLTNTHGFLTRSLRDAERVLGCVARVMPDDPWTAPGATSRRTRPRVAVLSSHPEGSIAVDGECVAAVDAAASALADVGYDVTETGPEAFRFRRSALVTKYVVDRAAELDEWSERTGTTIGPDDVGEAAWTAAEQGRATPAQAYLAALRALDVARRRIARVFVDVDVVLTPTVAAPAPAATEVRREEGIALAQFTARFNIGGQPALSIPYARFTDGMPLGVQLVARWGREDLLFRVARDLGFT